MHQVPDNTLSINTIIITQVCTVLPGDMALQCQTLATLLVPKIIEYLITNFDPTVTCKDVGICPGNTLHDDFTCPVCQLVLNTTLHQALDPDTQKQLHDAAHDACKLLQDDKVADCQARADEALNQLAAILRDVNPTHTCALLGLCSKGNGKTLRDVLMLARAKMQYVVMAAAGQAHVRGDFCEACQIAVLEAAAFLADPQTQMQLTSSAKAACTVMHDWQEQCSAYVDEYAPVAFNVALMYLKPEQMCTQVTHVCPNTTVLAAAAM